MYPKAPQKNSARGNNGKPAANVLPFPRKRPLRISLLSLRSKRAEKHSGKFPETITGNAAKNACLFGPEKIDCTNLNARSACEARAFSNEKFSTDMEDKINEILARAKAALPAAKTKTEVAEISASITGPKGELTAAMKLIPTLDKAQRPVVGKLINLAKSQIEPLISEAYARLENAEMAKALGEKPDATLPPCGEARGTSHPLTATIRKIRDIFKRAGFTVAEASDLETEWYCFDALNTPANHPARDAQDTLFMPRGAKVSNVSKHANELYLLRSHTSSVQIRAMMKEGAPIRIMAPGRAFRRDTVDATHSANFHQIECLCVDRGVKLTDLKAILDYLFKNLFGKSAKTRLRPSFFPFTEPSFEVDFMSSDIGRLSGRWIEIMGCGMVDPNVLENVGLDPKEYSGYAFGLGVERVAMLMHSIDDIRHFYANDVRFLRQFRSR